MKRMILFLCLALAACSGEPAPPPPADAPPPEPPALLEPVLGEWSDGTDTLTILEDGGALRMVEWGVEGAPDGWGPPRPVVPAGAEGVWVAEGPGDTLRLSAAPGGATLERAGRTWTPVALGPEDGAVFRIVPLRDPEELLSEALAASPPEEEGDFLPADLAELTDLDPTIRLDVRYAGTENFMGEVFYSQPRAFLQRPAAEALVRAHRWLGERGYGLLVHDGYRPWYVTKMFWEATPEPLRGFVADPSRGSRHNRGCAVDLTLVDLATGEAVEMPGGYDEFSPRAFPGYPGGTSRQRWHRELLRRAMEAQGFTVNPTEWWHFDHADWPRYRLANHRFEELG